MWPFSRKPYVPPGLRGEAAERSSERARAKYAQEAADENGKYHETSDADRGGQAREKWLARQEAERQKNARQESDDVSGDFEQGGQNA